VLQSPARECVPVAATAKEQRHPEWMDFTGPEASGARRGAGKAKAKSPRRSADGADAPVSRPRALFGTKQKP
jgi:hypothetical protein